MCCVQSDQSEGLPDDIDTIMKDGTDNFNRDVLEIKQESNLTLSLVKSLE